VTVTVSGVNQAPTFTGGGDDVTLEDSAPQTVTGWASSISQGLGDSGQVLNFVVTNNNNALFSVQPTVDPTSGDLTYTTAANAHGSATVTVTLHDNGGIANGGHDTSAPSTMTITVTAVNDAPTWTKGPDETVLENSSAKTVTSWASSFNAGPPDEQTQSLSIATTNDNNGLFSAQPSVTMAGTLTFTPAANANGSATVSVTLSDNGGTANGGVDHTTKTMTITVTPVNQAPSFTGGGNSLILEDGGAQTLSAWATNLSRGPSNESSQVLDFIVTNNNNGLFSVQPAVDPSSGNLTYTPAADANGSALVTVKLHDSGGTANGGVDTSPAQTMTITVTAVNDAPSFPVPADQTVLEDAGLQNVVGLAAPTSAGPANESGQVLTFTVTNDNNALFSSQPVLNPTTGTLTYQGAPNANGSALVTAVLSDDGGTANGGVDSVTHTFTISVVAVNDAPTFVKGADQTLDEEGSPVDHSVAGWATGFSPGPADEALQTNLGYSIVSDDHASLFSVQPAVSLSGTLTYTLAANRNGTAHVGITVQDSGGTANGGIDTSAVQTLTIKVNGVDHAPAAINDFPTVIQGSGPTTIDVLANDGDPDGDPLIVTKIVHQGTKGHAAVAANHLSVTYDPTGSFIGTDVFTYQISDGRGGLATGTVQVSVVRDTVAPVAYSLHAWIASGTVNTTATVTLTWKGSDQGFGVKYYQLQEKRNNTSWVWVTIPVGHTTINRVLTIGSQYQYRVRAVDKVGNAGPYTYLANFTPTLVQETAATFSGPWANTRVRGSLGGRIAYGATHGSVATFTCTCLSMAWIGPRGVSLNASRIYVDGTYLGFATEKSSRSSMYQVIVNKTWYSIGTHQLMISVTGWGPVGIDAFLTLQ
ncbi:MAG: tandem-95 repeat protein, partial [Candidatus Limnocylindrales bacterium]